MSQFKRPKLLVHNLYLCVRHIFLVRQEPCVTYDTNRNVNDNSLDNNVTVT